MHIPVPPLPLPHPNLLPPSPVPSSLFIPLFTHPPPPLLFFRQVIFSALILICPIPHCPILLFSHHSLLSSLLSPYLHLSPIRLLLQNTHLPLLLLCLNCHSWTNLPRALFSHALFSHAFFSSAPSFLVPSSHAHSLMLILCCTIHLRHLLPLSRPHIPSSFVLSLHATSCPASLPLLHFLCSIPHGLLLWTRPPLLSSPTPASPPSPPLLPHFRYVPSHNFDYTYDILHGVLDFEL